MCESHEEIEEIARCIRRPGTIVYAWLLYHPAGACVISGSKSLERLEFGCPRPGGEVSPSRVVWDLYGQRPAGFAVGTGADCTDI